MANNKTIEPTRADSGDVDKAFAKGSPNHSSPFLKTNIGRIRLNPKFRNIFSLFGLAVASDFSIIGEQYDFRGNKSPIIS